MSTNIASSLPERHVSASGHSRRRALSSTEAAHLFGPDGLREALARGEWVELWPGVVVPRERRNESTTRAAAALLRAGPAAVLSGLTAVALHGCSTGMVPNTEVTVPYDRQLRSRPGLTVRQGRIRESEVVELDELRVHALDVALTELLCNGPQRRALACLEQALDRLGRAGAEQLRGFVAERIDRRADRRGTRRATALLELARAPAVERESRGEPAERLPLPP